MPEFFWTLLTTLGATLIALFSAGVALVVATLALGVVWTVRDARQARDNAAMHEKIRLYLRQQLTAQE